MKSEEVTMKSNRSHLMEAAIVLCLICCARTSLAQTYGQALNRQWRSILGIPASDGAYQWFAYPADNFGVATSYASPAGRPLTDADRLCATWTCLGVNPSRIPTDEFRFISVQGFADSSLSSPFELVNDKQARDAAALLFSNLFNALALDGTVKLSRNAICDLRAVQVYRRSINMGRFQDYMESTPGPPATDPMRSAWNTGQLTIIAADIVARDLQLTFNVNSEKDPSINARLARAMAKLGRSGLSGVRLTTYWPGEYMLEFQGFTVLATQLRYQSKPGPRLGDGPSAPGPQHQLLVSTSTVPIPSAGPATLRVTLSTEALALSLDHRRPLP